MRTNLTVADLGDLLDQPLAAVLATLRTDGTVLLSPVYHEWRDGGFNTALRIAARYLGPEEGAADVEALSDADVIIRIEPGDIRIWDYTDEFSAD
jgi:hypothetical protein